MEFTPKASSPCRASMTRKNWVSRNQNTIFMCIKVEYSLILAWFWMCHFRQHWGPRGHKYPGRHGFQLSAGFLCLLSVLGLPSSMPASCSTEINAVCHSCPCNSWTFETRHEEEIGHHSSALISRACLLSLWPWRPQASLSGACGLQPGSCGPGAFYGKGQLLP